MNETQIGLIYLAACGVNGVIPDKERLDELDMEKLYCLSYSHFMNALVGTVLKQAGVVLTKGWNERLAKAIRKNVLFDAEREKLLSFMEQKGIWYLTLKGVILKEYYPALGMRQMSDNDILFDASFADEVKEYMVSQGYEVSYFGQGNHDVYKKDPIYNFEMHRALYSELHEEGWEQYYQDVKERLVLNSGSSYGYHFTEEDFYVYITSHAYKHYTGSGTGLRTLLDFYVYLKAKEQELDLTYVEKECEVLGIAEFERLNRELCKKVFGKTEAAEFESRLDGLSAEEIELLEYYLTAGVYGTVERGMENRIHKYREKSGSNSKLRYLLSRAFSTKEIYTNWPFFKKHKWLLPVAWFYRLIRPVFDKKRREKLRQELKTVRSLRQKA